MPYYSHLWVDYDGGFSKTLWTRRFDEEEVRVAIRLVKSRRHPGMSVVTTRLSSKRELSTSDTYVCLYCRKRFKKGTEYKSYDLSGPKRKARLCSEDCYILSWSTFENRMLMKQTCKIVKEHDEALKNDPDRLNIPKYLNTKLECLEEDHE